MKQRRLNLNPTGRTVYKVTHPAVEAARQTFTLEEMRFLTVEEAAVECGCGLPARVRTERERIRDAERGSARLCEALREALR
jgi:hypothetical protein